MFSNGYRVLDLEKDDKRLSLERLRKIDPAVVDLSEDELEKLRQTYYDWVQLMYESWCEDRNSSKNLTRSLTEN